MDRQRRCDRPRSEVQVSKKPSLQLVSMCGLYRSIEFGGERYTVGDHVLLRGTKTELICRLTGFSRNTTDDQATADVEWLYWPEEMTRELRNIPARKRPKLPDHTPNEVFTSDSRETIGVGTILSKVSVVCVPRFYPLSPTRHSGNQYCARWHWNTRAKKFTPVSDDDSMRKGSLLSAILTYQTPTKSSSQRTIHQTPTKSTARHTPLKTPTTNHKSTSQHAHITTPATNHRSTKQRTTPPKPHSKSSSVKKGLVREVSVSLSRNPIICRSPSQQRSNASPKSSQPLSSLNPRHNGVKNGAKGKPTPGRGVLISKTPDQPRKRSTRSTQSARISHADCVDILTNGVNGHMDEMPLPPISGRAPNSTKSRSDRGRERTRDAGEKEEHMETTPKRESRLNTSDVLDLLGDEGEVEGFEEEEEDELIGDPGTATDKEVGKNQTVVRGRGELTLPGSDRHSEKHEKGASECARESKESEKRLETAKTKKMGTTRKGEEKKKKVRCKSNKTTAGTSAGGTSGQVKVPEDILTSPKKGLVDEDFLTTPSGKKWSLRARSEVKPPTYLSNNMAGNPLPISEELACLKRKRDRSPTRLLDILISEPEEKKMKHTTTPAHTAENRSEATQNHQKPRGKGAQELRATGGKEGEMKGDYRGSESGAVHRTPEEKPRLVKPHTLPRRKKPTSTDVTVEYSTTPVTRHQLRRNRREILRLEPANSSKYLSEKLSRKRRLSGPVDWDKVSEESESDGDDVEYELSGEDPVSDSEMEEEEGEEEEEEEEESDFSFEGGLMSHTPGSVSNWSPDHSVIAKKTPRISHQKITRKTKTPSKTPHSQAASRRTPARRTPVARTPSKRTPARRTPAKRTPGARTPGGRTPAKRTPGGRVVPTPHIPERRKSTGRMGNSNFDKVRQR